MARLTMLAPRLAALVLIWLLAATSITFAAGGSETQQSPAQTGTGGEKPEVIVVPDVRGQTFVFAKGILQDAGLAWRVDGPVKGYAANTVATQDPAAGTRVVDNGAPTVIVRLQRNPDYPERGLPENASAYPGTPVVLLRDWQLAQPTETGPLPTTTAPAATTAPTETAPVEEQPEREYRTPDFEVTGAPPEPADELPLPERALMVERRLAGDRRPGRRLIGFWLYQHSWIVTGASFGWKDGDEALRIIIRVDESLERRFGFGAKSAAVARRALAEVERRKG